MSAPLKEPGPGSRPYPEPPPPYSTSPPTYNQPTGTYGPVTAVTVVNVAEWGPYPMQVTCPHCGAHVMTETSAVPGLLTWLLSGALLFLGCWLGCCLIPCCIPECQDTEHRCPSCKHHIGTYRRM